MLKTANVKQTLRPVKIGILINPFDENSLLKAIEINTFLWGGCFNPIIPFYPEKPEHWKNHEKYPGRIPSPEEVVQGYLNRYDPDFILPININNDLLSKINLGDREVISSRDIFEGYKKGYPNYGIGLFENLNHFIEKEYKFKRRKEINFALPDSTSIDNLFVASCFGYIANENLEIFNKYFKNILKVKAEQIDYSSYIKFLNPNYYFLRFLTEYNLKPFFSSYLSDVIFYFDAENPEDIIDYINLRAIVRAVFPIPIQSSSNVHLNKALQEFINQNYYLKNKNGVYNRASLVKSRNISEEEFKNFIDKYEITDSKGKLMHQFWFPKLYKNFDEYNPMVMDHINTVELDIDEKWQEVFIQGSDFEKKFIKLETLKPSFYNKFKNHGKCKFANEIELITYRDEEPIAQVFPNDGIKDLFRGLILGKESRLSNKGIVSFSNSSIFLYLPKAEDIFLRWLNSNGWKTSTEPPLNKLTKQVLKNFEGGRYLNFFSHKDLIDLLNKNNKKPIKSEELNALISKVLQNHAFKPKRQEVKKESVKLIEQLMDKKILKLGLEITCPVCGQESWHSLEEIKYKNNSCHKCDEKYTFPSHNTKELKWSYKIIGPYSTNDAKTNSLFSQLLTLNFLNMFNSMSKATVVFNIIAERKDVKKMEFDIGLLYQESELGDYKHLIFAECKSYNEFKEEDVGKMKILAKQFPGAIIIFSKLGKSFSKQEITLIKPLAEEGRKYWNNRPLNPILLLTENELFLNGHISIKDRWEKLGGEYTKFVEDWRHTDNLLDFCDATQQLYLNMPDWHKWLEENDEQIKKLKNLKVN